MTDITIPPAALEAARKASHDLSKDCPIEAACLAMLEAWPGMAYRYRMSVSLKPQEIILPLPPEKETRE